MSSHVGGGRGEAAPARVAGAPLTGLVLPSEVHVRWTSGAGTPERLTREERAQADSYGTRRRAAFVLGRSLLRTMAGELLARAPDEVPLLEAPGGALVLPGTPWHVNLTHAGALAGCVMAPGRVGIDAEVVRPRAEGLWGRMLAPGEQPPAWPGWAADETLLLVWTVKEAALKAAGIGLRRGATAAVLSFPAEEGLIEARTPEGCFLVSAARTYGAVWAVAWEA